MKKNVLLLYLVVSLFACKKQENKEIAFYHWKADATFSEAYQKALNISNTKKIYLHYFDIKPFDKTSAHPTYVIKNIAKQYSSYEIIPVIYITNSVLQTENLNTENLGEKIEKLVHQISKKHFNKKITKLQIDCDWTKSTKNSYFSLLETLKSKFDIDITIRLHQIKFQKSTDIPPVKKGTLMLYNMGDLKDKSQNSILSNTAVKQYINNNSNYPLKLNIALPLFSQTIVFNNDNKIKIIKDTNRESLKNDTHFKKKNNTLFTVVKDTLYKGFYLSKGYELKLEETTENEIIAAYKTIKKSNLATQDIILYHLDEQSLSKIDVNNLVKQL